MKNGPASEEIADRIRGLTPFLPAESSAALLSETPRLSRYLALLLSANERMNLVSAAAARPEELVGRHLLDSLLALPLLPSPTDSPLSLLDIGSGGGFPALPILLVRGDIRGTLVESTTKKSCFLTETIRALSLTAEVVNARFPDSFPMQPLARFDLLTSRAVGRAGRLVRAARALLGPGARVLLWTTEGLYGELVRTSGFAKGRFQKAPGAKSRGIAVLEGST